MHTTTHALQAITDEQRHPSIMKLLVQHAGAITRGLSLLAEARDFAQGLDREIWDFAVELPALHAVGLSNSTIRCLLCMGYFEHSRGPVASSSLPDFCRNGTESLAFTPQSRFVLTQQGAETLQRLNLMVTPETVCGEPLLHARGEAETSVKPVWDSEYRELRFAGHLVKRFKLPSPNQEMVLSSFQEEGWPVRIDDPLPPVPDILPKRRLHDTIKSLNRSQKCHLIRFLGDGRGEGVRWEVRWPDSFGEELTRTELESE